MNYNGDFRKDGKIQTEAAKAKRAAKITSKIRGMERQGKAKRMTPMERRRMVAEARAKRLAAS